MSTGSCRHVPGHPSKHGANIDPERSRPLPEPLPVEVQLHATRYMSPAPGVQAETVSTVRDPCWQRLGFDGLMRRLLSRADRGGLRRFLDAVGLFPRCDLGGLASRPGLTLVA